MHNLCLWDEKSIPKIKQELEADILDFIKTVQEVCSKCKKKYYKKYDLIFIY